MTTETTRLPPTVGAVIVTHESADSIEACVKSALRECTEVVVVDTESLDDSASTAARLGARTMRVPNRGFGAACNEGARLVDSDLLLLLNPDAVLDADTVTRLVDAHTRLADAGVKSALGPKFEGEGIARIQSYGLWYLSSSLAIRRALGPLGWRPRAEALAGVKIVQVPRLSGAALLVDLNTFRSLGGFDETFFLYFEDADLSLRLREHGLITAIVPDAQVAHAKAQSTGRRADIEIIRSRSALYLSRKHRGRLGELLAVADLILMNSARAALHLLRGRPRQARLRLQRLRALLPGSL